MTNTSFELFDTLESYYNLSNVLDTYDGLRNMFGIPSPINSLDEHYHALDIIAILRIFNVVRQDSKERSDYCERCEDFATAFRKIINGID